MNGSFQSVNVGEFTIANISYFSESGIWLCKILVNGVRFAIFAKVSSAKILCYTYGILHYKNQFTKYKSYLDYCTLFFAGWWSK